MPQSSVSAATPLEQAFVCAPEASALMNCAATTPYIEQRCLALLKRLRRCVEAQRVATFTLLPDAPSPSAGEPPE